MGGVEAKGDLIAVTGLGAISALGNGCKALWEAIAGGRDGIRPIDRFSTEAFSVHLGALVPGSRVVPPGTSLHSTLCVDFALAAGREALSQAGAHSLAADRIALVLGTSLGDGLNQLTEKVADELGARGIRITISTACSSSTNALGLGADLLRGGMADLVLAGGSDVLTPELFAGFHALGVLSPGKCAPFSVPAGATLGEGAGFLVLERSVDARARGAKALALVLGYGLSCDAYHETSPDPTGAGVARAARGALADAGIDPGEIGYVNAHGTGTLANDPAEWLAYSSVFGERARTLPISSSKGQLGHAQGAAGALEAITTVLGLQHQALPPTHSFTTPRPNAPVDPVGQQGARPARFRCALSCNSAFAGANAAVVLALPGATGRPRPSRRVIIAAASAVGPHGLELADFERELGSGNRARRVPEFSIEQLVPTTDPRGLDPSARFLIAAAARSIEDGALAVHGQARDRTGLIIAAARVSRASHTEFGASIKKRGLARLSSAAFARLVINAATGSCARSFSFKGPTSTLVTGEGGGLAAIVYAAQLLATRADVDLLLAGGVDEIDGQTPEPFAEGAGLLALRAAAAGERAPEPFAEGSLSGSGHGKPRSPRAVSRGVDLASAAPEPFAEGSLSGSGHGKPRPPRAVSRGVDLASAAPEPFAEGAGLRALRAAAAAEIAPEPIEERAGLLAPVISAAGWALAGPDHFGDAARLALTRAGLGVDQLDAVFGLDPRAAASLGAVRLEPALGTERFEAAGSALAAVAAVLALRRGQYQTVLVGSSAGRSLSSALILTTQAAAPGGH